MAIEQVYGTPGVRAPRTADYRRILRQGDYTFFAGGGIIAATYTRDTGNSGDVDILRPGLLMGKRSSGGLWANSIIGVANGAVSAGATSITVAAAVVTELVRRVGASGTFKLIGPAVANTAPVVTETITYSAASGTTITCTATVNAFVTGSFLCPTDGSETMRSFLPDGFNTKVTDQDGTSTDTEWGQIPVAGVIDASQLINWPTDTALQAFIMSRLNDLSGGQFVFDHVYVA